MTNPLVISASAQTSPHLVNVVVTADTDVCEVYLTIAGRIMCDVETTVDRCAGGCRGHRISGALTLPPSAVWTMAHVLTERHSDCVTGQDALVSTSVKTRGIVRVDDVPTWTDPALETYRREGDLLELRVAVPCDDNEPPREPRLTVGLPVESTGSLRNALTECLFP
jgi:hypothetical protein